MFNFATESLYWRYENQELANTDFVANLTQSICEESGLTFPNPTLQIVLSEILTNAIDHGVLGLDSKIKDTPDGFAAYLTARTSRLAQLESAWVSITSEKLNNGNIQIAVQDSGEGFEYAEGLPLNDSPLELSLYGRGLLIVSSLCVSMSHVGNGNCIVIEFDASAFDSSNASCSGDLAGACS